jgi:hypothetical protein
MWKKMPYYLKGGVIGLIVAIVYNIVELILLGKGSFSEWLYGFVIDLIGLFIIGAIIGALLGLYINTKRKNKMIVNKQNKSVKRGRKKRR